MQSNQFEVVVVGAGIAGLVAAAAAANRGLKVALVATGPGSFVLGPGWLKTQGFANAKPSGEFLNAVAFFRKITRLAGCPFAGEVGTTRHLPTVLGEFQSVTLAPFSLWNGQPCDEKQTAVVGIRGLSSFDENFIADRLNKSSRLLGFKGKYVARQITLKHQLGVALTSMRLARCFDRDPDFRHELITSLLPIAAESERILVPGILGFVSDESELIRFESELGCSVSEMPTLPPSIPGLRLYHRLRGYLQKMGVEFYEGFPVRSLQVSKGECVAVQIDSPGRPLSLESESVVLAVGHETETLLAGTGVHQDEAMHPLTANNAVIASNVFVAGSSGNREHEITGDAAGILTGYRAGNLAASTEVLYAAG